MIPLTIVLITFASIFFGIVYANLDGTIVLYRKATGNVEHLKHNTRVVIRVVFSFFMALLGMICIGNSELLTFLAMILLSYSAVVLIFDFQYNKVVRNSSVYMGKTAVWDRLMNKLIGEDHAALLSFGIKTTVWVFSAIYLTFFLN